MFDSKYFNESNVTRTEGKVKQTAQSSSICLEGKTCSSDPIESKQKMQVKGDVEEEDTEFKEEGGQSAGGIGVGTDEVKERVKLQERLVRDQLQQKYEAIENEAKRLGQVKIGLEKLEEEQQKDIDILRQRIETIQKQLVHAQQKFKTKEKEYVESKQHLHDLTNTKAMLTE